MCLKRNKYLIAIIALTCFLPSSSTLIYSQDNSQKIIDLLNSKDWQNAETEIEKALEFYPDKEWLYSNQIWVRQNLNKFEKGIAIGKLGLYKWPESLAIKKALSYILCASANNEINHKNYAKSIQLIEDAVIIFPNDYSYYLLGVVYRELKNYSKAIESLETGKRIYPKSTYFIESLPYTRYLQFKNILETEQGLSLESKIKTNIDQIMIQLDSTKSFRDDYYNSRIVSLGLRKLGDLDYFEKTYSEVTKIFPNDPDVWDSYGFEYYALIRDKRAVNKEEKARAISFRKKAISIYEKINPNRQEITNVSFPLQGKYFILSQFEGSGMTHNGFAKYCYDFIKVDSSNSFIHPGTEGKVNSDYYNFGEKIYAIADGTITDLVSNEPDNEPGGYSNSANYVTIKHNGYTSFYAHLKQKSIKVNLGDKVKKGSVIGLSGNSGMSVESHLHFCLNDKNWVSIPFRFKKTKITSKNSTILSDRPYKEDEVVEFK